MKKRKRVASLVLVSVIFSLLLAATACGGRKIEGQEQVDTQRTQLYVGIYNGGYGHDWFDPIKEGFEAIYPDVQVLPNYGKDQYEWWTLQYSMDSIQDDLFFAGTAYLPSAQACGKLLDITEIAETDVEGQTVEERMYPELRGYFSSYDSYVALPYNTSVYYINYDVDLWDLIGLWMNDEGKFYCELSPADKATFVKGKGQDCVAGTWDDGCPVTYSQFFRLIKLIKQNSCVPFTWTADYWQPYHDETCQTMKAYFQDPEEFLSESSSAVEGEGVQIKTVDADKLDQLNKNDEVHGYGYFNEKPLDAISSVKTVTYENYEQIQLEAAMYYVNCFWGDVMDQSDGKNFTSFSVSPGETHLDAQEHFLRSAVEPAVTDGRVAMFIDGDWWEKEAEWVFKDMASVNGEEYSMQNRRFGVMPFPLPDDREDTTGCKFQSGSQNTVMFIKKSTKIPEIAKNFLKYVFTREGMTILSEKGYFTPYSYGLDRTNAEGLTYYKRQQGEIKTDGKQVMFNIPNNETARINHTLWQDSWGIQFTGTPSRYFFYNVDKYNIDPNVTPEGAFKNNYNTYKNSIMPQWQLAD